MESPRPVITWTRDAQTISVITQNRIYHRRLANENPLRFWDSEEEFFIDPIADPEGERNLFPLDPNAASRLVRAAERYFEVYPWLLVEGRSGLPASNAATAAQGASP